LQKELNTYVPLRIGLIFGGRLVEHEVSFNSASGMAALLLINTFHETSQNQDNGSHGEVLKATGEILKISRISQNS